MTMNRYESYQDSGIQWLGEIPEHWTLGNLMYFISCSSGDALPSVLIHKNESNDINIPVIGGNGLFGYTDNSNFTENCLAIGRVGALCGNVHYINYPSWINDNALIVKLRTDKIYLNFLDYFFQSRNLNELASKTAQPLLTGTQVKKEKIAIPPLPEQTAIADYLDNKLGEIDALISKQETLLAKLAEQRTAMITHAVTKGLNAHAPMKNSGVAWLGDVPEHWEVKRLKNSTISAQNGVWGDEAKYDDNDVYCIRVADFNRYQFTINKNDLTVRNISNRDYENRKLSMGDLLLEKSGGGEKQPVGFVVFNTFNGKAVCSNFIARVQLADNMNSKYWTYFHSLLYSARVNIRSIKQSTGIQNLDATLYFNELACYPPLPEQTAIADYLDEQTAKIDHLSDTVNQTIARLKEYRSALITQAVTGKIKVI